MSSAIKTIKARQVLDCKARPMLEVDVVTANGTMGRGSAPTGTSVGKHESFVLRDHDPHEFQGLSVHRAVEVVEQILAPALVGMDVEDQPLIDQKMIDLDGTQQKENLGGNSIYSISVACLRAAAALHQVPVYQYLAGKPLETIPLPTFNIVNGGRYPHLTQPFNEFILAPWRASCVEEAIEIAIMVYQRLETVLSRYSGGAKPALGSSYGWAAPSEDPLVVLQLIAQAVEECGYTNQVAYCLDCASSEMYDSATNTYEYKSHRISADELIGEMERLTKQFPLLFVEDLLDENDWDGYAKAHKILTGTRLIGDDFIVTNRQRLERAYRMNCVDGFILKPNQVGTITEALDTYSFAREHSLLTIPSGRAGGSIDDVVADLALGLHVPISKNGAPRSGERLNKINSLLRASSENPLSHLAVLDCFPIH